MLTPIRFEFEYCQFLDKDGKVTQSLPDFAQDQKTLLALYRAMWLTRTLDKKAVLLQRMGKMGTYPSSLGQEAVYAGIGSAMQADDVYCPAYRDQGTMLLRGVKPAEILSVWGGDERGNDYSAKQAKQDFPISIPIATQMLHAAGAAYAIKLRHQKQVVVTTCGDGGTSKGDFYTAMNFAGVQHLPMVFVINNNQWAISVSRKMQTAAQTLAQKAIAAGFNGLQVDGNDVIAVRHEVANAIEKARNGGGPTLIEAITFRLCDHTTADDASRYVNKADLEAAWEVEPLIRLRTYLINQKWWSEKQEEELQQACNKEMEAAVEEFLNKPAQPATAILDYMYAELPAAFSQQRESLKENHE
jgi:pyruvate dehydrogenase E1 component alpha subunit